MRLTTSLCQLMHGLQKDIMESCEETQVILSLLEDSLKGQGQDNSSLRTERTISQVVSQILWRS